MALHRRCTSLKWARLQGLWNDNARRAHPNRSGGGLACPGRGLAPRLSPVTTCLTASRLRHLTLAAQQIVVLRSLADDLLHVFGQQVAGLY